MYICMGNTNVKIFYFYTNYKIKVFKFELINLFEKNKNKKFKINYVK